MPRTVLLLNLFFTDQFFLLTKFFTAGKKIDMCITTLNSCVKQLHYFSGFGYRLIRFVLNLTKNVNIFTSVCPIKYKTFDLLEIT